MNRSLVRIGLALMILSWATMAPASTPVVAHQADIVFDIEAHTITVTDRFVLPEGVTSLRLGPGLVLEGMAWEAAEDEDGPYQLLDLTATGLVPGDVLELVYSGTFHESVEDLVFSRENVGKEITATISDEGIYMSAMAEWLAWSEGALATHDLTITTPAGFETVTQGRRELHEETGDHLRTRWVADHASDGLTLVAHRFHVHEEPMIKGVVAQTFFLEDDARLRATYMERTGAYLEMYEEMIGPYPYAKFATVENWFPTGYGMPSYTLLGGQVLRLPFIPYTSFGHEIAHNWWGNSVFVDLDEGNWCEGLTVYCADYHYKQLESDEAAREYRRNLLKDYAAYVTDPTQDFPLSEFKSRHSGASRAVGYGKSMMVFHMVDRLVGRENFLAGLRSVAAEHMFAEAGWSDFMTAFEFAGGTDLDPFAKQWLTRPGAPDLALEKTTFEDSKVAFTLVQAEPAFALRVPVVVTTALGAEEHILEFDEASRTFEIEGSGITSVAVDPDCHLFRRLDPSEIEPTISQVLGAEDPTFVVDEPTVNFRAAAENFAREFSEVDEVVLTGQGGAREAGRSAIVINPGPDLLGELKPESLTVSGSTLFLDGKRYSLKDFDLVFSTASPAGGASHLVVLSDSVRRLEVLAGRIGHYGKYSWLLLPKGQGRVLRGNWPVGDSPLIARR